MGSASLENNVDLTIIVPCFNSEKTIGICLQSLLSQTYQRLQILIVDASPNELTKNAINVFQPFKKNVIYLRAQKKGTAAQCAQGIRFAGTPYIGFVDSDDYVHPEAFSLLMRSRLAFETDIASFRFKIVHDYRDFPPSTEIPSTLDIKVLKGRKYAKFRHCYKWYHKDFSRWLHVVDRAKLLPFLDCYESLPENHWEDAIYVFCMIVSCSSAAIIDCPLYFYVQNDSLHTSTRKIEDPFSHIDYLFWHQSVAQSIFERGHRAKDAGQSFWPLFRTYTYMLHWPSVLSNKASYSSFIRYRRRDIWLASWKLPLSMVPNKYERRLLIVIRFGLLKLFGARLIPHKND